MSLSVLIDTTRPQCMIRMGRITNGGEDSHLLIGDGNHAGRMLSISNHSNKAENPIR